MQRAWGFRLRLFVVQPDVRALGWYPHGPITKSLFRAEMSGLS